MHEEIALFLCGDVMTGRGIDQLLPRPCEPTLYEPYVTSANEYVALAENANGPLPRPVDFGYPWGEAIAELKDRRPDLHIINLETSVTRHAEPEPADQLSHEPREFCLHRGGRDRLLHARQQSRSQLGRSRPHVGVYPPIDSDLA